MGDEPALAPDITARPVGLDTLVRGGPFVKVAFAT